MFISMDRIDGAVRRFTGCGTPSKTRKKRKKGQKGLGVPTEKLEMLFPRILANLKAALREIPHVRVFDNDDLRSPYRLTSVYTNGKLIQLHNPISRSARKRP